MSIVTMKECGVDLESLPYAQIMEELANESAAETLDQVDAADRAWHAEATRDDECDQVDDGADWDSAEWDREIIELGPDPDVDYAVLMSEPWTLSPGAEADFEHCPGLIG